MLSHIVVKLTIQNEDVEKVVESINRWYFSHNIGMDNITIIVDDERIKAVDPYATNP